MTEKDREREFDMYYLQKKWTPPKGMEGAQTGTGILPYSYNEA